MVKLMNLCLYRTGYTFFSWDSLLSSEAIGLDVGERLATLDADHIAREPVLFVLGHELGMLAGFALPSDS